MPGHRRRPTHIKLTSHPTSHGPTPLAIRWGAPDPLTRGPVIATTTGPAQRNVIGSHAGGYAIYRALAAAAGALAPARRPDLPATAPAFVNGPHPQWPAP